MQYPTDTWEFSDGVSLSIVVKDTDYALGKALV